MPRFFIELSYKGSRYSGFQKQDNAVTIQSEVEKALKIYYKKEFQLTGSSRTDAGVHAHQNFFHFNADSLIIENELYHLNAILPNDIVVKRIIPVEDNAHCRFDAVSRTYQYCLYQQKNPFLEEVAWFYPYPIDISLLNEAATIIKNYTDFRSFSKANTQVNNYRCQIFSSYWVIEKNSFNYNVTANRFLRGMVRALVATMLKVGRKKITINEFENIIASKNSINADFASPSKGLFLQHVNFLFIKN
jgi:tRNA pseudouridine38-40 synthase